ncbi:MarR family transcriptional regulator, partial [Aliarcobacter butzleri]|nr:MarR family transcriptional regulator [Aliarcobacter butzleri]
AVKNDKRKNLVCLTPKGIELIEEIMDNKASMIEKTFSVLDKKEKENLKSILSKVLYSLN